MLEKDAGVVKKMQEFSECSLFRCRQCEKKVNRAGNI